MDNKEHCGTNKKNAEVYLFLTKDSQNITAKKCYILSRMHLIYIVYKFKCSYELR
jgi:hypothetical protein